MDLIDKKISDDVGLKLELKEGKLLLSAKVDSKGADVELVLLVEPEYFIGKLKDLIPGQVDDAILDIMIAALKAQK